MALVALADREIDALTSVLGDDVDADWLSTPVARTSHDEEIAASLSDLFSSARTAHWMAVLGAAGVPIAVSRTERFSVAFLRDPENRIDRRVSETVHPTDGNVGEIDQLIRIADVVYPQHRVAAELLGDTDDVLTGFGYNADDLAGLRLRGAIG